MILKKIYSANKNHNLEKRNEKKALNKHLYNKFITRSHLLGNTNFRVLDNNSNFYNISTTDLEKLNFYLKDEPTGGSLNLKLFSYKNKFNSSIQFKSFNFNNKIDSFSSSQPGPVYKAIYVSKVLNNGSFSKAASCAHVLLKHQIVITNKKML